MENSACCDFLFWYIFIFFNSQWENIATKLHLIHMSISIFSSFNLITKTPLLYGIGRMNFLGDTALKISSVTQQSMSPVPPKRSGESVEATGPYEFLVAAPECSGFSKFRIQHQRNGVLLGDTIRWHKWQRMSSK